MQTVQFSYFKFSKQFNSVRFSFHPELNHATPNKNDLNIYKILKYKDLKLIFVYFSYNFVSIVNQMIKLCNPTICIILFFPKKKSIILFWLFEQLICYCSIFIHVCLLRQEKNM